MGQVALLGLADVSAVGTGRLVRVPCLNLGHSLTPTYTQPRDQRRGR
jgi:hypothetical protein